jgi:hypothetical protein
VGPRGFRFFQFIQNWLDLKNKMGAFTCSKNTQYLHMASLGYHEQFSQFCRHQITNTKRVKIPITDSIFESLMDFKIDLILLENMINSPKFLFDLIFKEVNLVGITCMQEIELQYKCQTA